MEDGEDVQKALLSRLRRARGLKHQEDAEGTRDPLSRLSRTWFKAAVTFTMMCCGVKCRVSHGRVGWEPHRQVLMACERESRSSWAHGLK